MWKLPITLAVLCIAGNLRRIDLLHIQLINLLLICIITLIFLLKCFLNVVKMLHNIKL